MLDIKRIREDFDGVKKAVMSRGKGDYDIDRTIELDDKRRELLAEVEALKAKQNKESKRIPQMKKAGEDTTELMADLKSLSDQISGLDEQVKAVKDELRDVLLRIPNTPSATTPIGKDETENVEQRKWGEPTKFDFEPKAHWDIGTDLDILDFDRAAKLSGARFTVYKGKGARLERSLINFMLNTHTEEQGYTEVFPPFLVGKKAMTGTGQLPKFIDDMFYVQDKDEFLIPTAEVPLTNLRSDEIIDGSELPLYYTAYTACFRKEAGSAGRDTRGIIRQHQFNKVEMVKIVKPEDSWDELDKLTDNAEDILRKLGLPYRVIALCTGDTGFSAAKTFDVEVWMPSYNRYVEISSCSNTEDFQARRANIRFRRDPKSKPEYVHTLNGSGLAVGRCLAAILENYQNADGTVTVPEVLRPYMGCDVIEGK
ncbi:MAG: serine--tRNA ligase [Anaerovoracaceae bacterium]|nr:serine--tRNA ligase [Bacillota bacterium]MDY2670769.1 serine--tRNA ligase [Anaerovoracaceae bacterium]